MAASKKEIQSEEEFFEEISSEDEDKYINVSAPYKISFYGADFTLSVLYQKLNDHEIVIPDFQRRYVWDKRRASRLIESFLLGIPVPPIFVFREPETQKLLVVDGNQRLTSIKYFMDGTFTTRREFSLMNVLDRWNGKTFKSLSSQDQIKLKDSVLRTIIFEQNDFSDNRSMYQIFERLNTETSPLRDQEIRNALYRGKFNDLLKELNEHAVWRDLLGTRQPLPRMRDIEMILRFFALYYSFSDYSKPMKQFLNDFMKNDLNLKIRDDKTYKNLFYKTMDLIHAGLGRDAFRIKAGINVALFDAITIGVATTKPNKEKLGQAKVKLLKNSGFKEAVEKHTTDKDKITRRVDLAIKFFASK